MKFGVVGTALLRCSFGSCPTPLGVLPQCRVLCENMPVATIMDNKPFVNIQPFGMCSSPANPTVAAATSAAMGVLTPMPCVPIIAAPWSPGNPTLMLGGIPALSQDCRLMCIYGGVITIDQPGQFTVQY